MNPSNTQTTPATRCCPVCGGDNTAAPAYPASRDAWVLKACAACGCVYLENPPTYEALEEEFAWEKTSAQEETRRRTRRPAAKAISTAWKAFRQKVLKRDKLMDLVPRFIPGGKVLDIGCGGGGTLARLPGDHYIPHGIEISKQLALTADAHARPRGGHVVQASALDGARTFEEATFDGVLMSAFLEHEVQPGPLLQALHRILKPGGCVIIKVPNHACWNRSVRGAEWCGYRFPDHVNYFSPATLSRLARDCGYQIARFSLPDRFPLSDNMWLVIRKPA